MVDFSHGTQNFLKRREPHSVCSTAIVFPSGSSFFRVAALYASQHDGSLWFQMCKLSMTFCIHIHALPQGEGHGKGLFAAFKPSNWHMLSYARKTLPQFSGFICFEMQGFL